MYEKLLTGIFQWSGLQVLIYSLDGHFQPTHLDWRAILRQGRCNLETTHDPTLA
jgi:hypothetical protein